MGTPVWAVSCAGRVVAPHAGKTVAQGAGVAVSQASSASASAASSATSSAINSVKARPQPLGMACEAQPSHQPCHINCTQSTQPRAPSQGAHVPAPMGAPCLASQGMEE